MKKIALVLMLCSLSGAAIAQTECKSISKVSDRLACYDKANPPVTKQQNESTKSSPAEPEGQNVDGLAKESARLNKAIGNICRGC